MTTYGFSAPNGLLSDEQSFASFVCFDTNGHDVWTLIEDPTMERVRGVIENVLRVGPGDVDLVEITQGSPFGNEAPVYKLRTIERYSARWTRVSQS